MSVWRECEARVSWQDCQARVDDKRVQQECLARVSRKSVLSRVSDKSVRQECLTRVSSKIHSRFSTRTSHKCVQQVCPIRVSRKRFLPRVSKRASSKNARQGGLTRVSCKGVLQEFWNLGAFGFVGSFRFFLRESPTVNCPGKNITSSVEASLTTSYSAHDQNCATPAFDWKSQIISILGVKTPLELHQAESCFALQIWAPFFTCTAVAKLGLSLQQEVWPATNGSRSWNLQTLICNMESMLACYKSWSITLWVYLLWAFPGETLASKICSPTMRRH